MSTSDTDTDGDAGNEAENDAKRGRHLPAHLLGRIRTSTAGLLVAFVLVLGLYLYTRPDPTTVENSPVYIPPATSTEVAPTQVHPDPGADDHGYPDDHDTGAGHPRRPRTGPPAAAER